MSAALVKKLEKLEAQLAKLKVEIKEKPKKSTKAKKSSKPASIDKCSKKEELAKFTVSELKDWVKANRIDTKKLKEKLKADLVAFVWKNLKKQTESESESSDSETDTDSSDTDSDSDSSGSESD